jgi:hypothetical protein
MIRKLDESWQGVEPIAPYEIVTAKKMAESFLVGVRYKPQDCGTTV